MEIGYIKDRTISEEMQESYLDYAMSVIVTRALPDIRDGLKPVQRRILYAMWSLGLKSSAKFRKSATVVGEVLGKYHPHGDTAVYDTMVRMAQDFSLRYPLVNGQGNFGSIDGDNAAAMRYTEAKLEKISEEMLVEINKDTVDFRDNYDRTQKEPSVLPSIIPNMLLNGSTGIAVGMATNIAPHNLGEVIDALTFLIDNPEGTIEDLMKFIKGPDFPTGGIIFNRKDIANTYTTGKGGIVMRAKTDIEETKKGYFQIVVTEIPYQVNKSSLIEKIANLVKDKKIDGIKDIRDESDKDGIRVVIELKKDVVPKQVLNRLFKLTSLQEKFHSNMIGLVDGLQPRVLNLKSILEYYIKFRKEVVVRRTEFELRRAKERAHILEGLKIAVDNIDEVIKIIKKSANRDIAKNNLIKRFKLSEIQADAILDMRLSQLSALEVKKIEEELKALRKLIAELEALLASDEKIFNLMKEEFSEIKEKYADERRTKVYIRAVDDFAPEDLIKDENVVITITRGGYIKSLPENTYKQQARGGKGIAGMATKEEDIVEHIIVASTLSDVLFFTNSGKVFQLKAYEIPKTSRQAKGNSIVNFLQLAKHERISAIISRDSKDTKYQYLCMATNAGLIKKVSIEQFAKVRRSGLITIKLKSDDELSWVEPSTGSDEILLVSSNGQAIRFKESEIRPMGRSAAGVKGMRLRKSDEIINMNVINKEIEVNSKLLVITEKGYGKRTKLKEYKVQGRGGSGIKTAKITDKNGPLISAKIVNDEVSDMLIVSEKAQVIRIEIKNVPMQGRATQGVRLIRLAPGDKTATIACL